MKWIIICSSIISIMVIQFDIHHQPNKVFHHLNRVTHQFGQASAQPDFQSFSLLNLNHYSPLVTEFREDVFYRNGKKKYDSFHKHFFFENGTKAFDGFHNHAFYADNGVKAFDGFHGHVMYHNGKQAYNGFFYKAKYENGND
jgi:hypothetical protein